MLKQKTLTQNTAYYTLALVIQKALAFVYFAFLARGLGVEDQGKYSFAFSFTTIFSVFVDVGLSSVLTREIAKDKSNTKKILANVLGVKIILSSFVYLLIILLINLMGYPEITKNLVYLTGLIMLLDTFSSTFWGVLRGNQNLKYESVGGIIFQFLVVGLGLSLLYFKVGVTMQVLAVMFGSSFLCIFSYAEMRRRVNIKPSFEFDFPLIKKLIIISIPFALTGLLARLNTQVDTIFLSKIGCASREICDSNVGIYSVATKIILAIHFIPLAFVAALFPALSEYFATDKKRLTDTFEKAMKYLMIIGTPVAFGLISLAPDLVPKLFGVEYKNSVLPLQILSISLPFLFLTFPIGSLLNACSKQMQNTIQVGIAVLANFLLNIYLIPKISYVGGAISSLVSTLIMFYLGIRAAKKIVDYDKKYILISFLQCLFSGLIMAGLLRLMIFRINFLILIPIGAIIYIFTLFIVGGIKKREIQEILISMKIKKGRGQEIVIE
jgi:O-antigen/teichoic acid export membrane protein